MGFFQNVNATIDPLEKLFNGACGLINEASYDNDYAYYMQHCGYSVGSGDIVLNTGLFRNGIVFRRSDRYGNPCVTFYNTYRTTSGDRDFGSSLFNIIKRGNTYCLEVTDKMITDYALRTIPDEYIDKIYNKVVSLRPENISKTLRYKWVLRVRARKRSAFARLF